MSYAGLLNMTATRKASTVTKEHGYPKKVMAETAGIRCTVQPASSRVALQHQKRTGTTTFDGYFPAGQTVAVDDLWQIDTGPLAGRTFRVIGPGMDAAGRGHHVEAVLEENRP